MSQCDEGLAYRRRSVISLSRPVVLSAMETGCALLRGCAANLCFTPPRSRRRRGAPLLPYYLGGCNVQGWVARRGRRARGGVLHPALLPLLRPSRHEEAHALGQGVAQQRSAKSQIRLLGAQKFTRAECHIRSR